ncbi:hypothetical protein VNI00_008108 [Paramarasmius palmivorus]|uniref:Enamelin n=1 Tax=Paramarasmius palmivorus TaxID=297713 RepID=A0AAW0CXG5_9AGAR
MALFENSHDINISGGQFNQVRGDQSNVNNYNTSNIYDSYNTSNTSNYNSFNRRKSNRSTNKDQRRYQAQQNNVHVRGNRSTHGHQQPQDQNHSNHWEPIDDWEDDDDDPDPHLHSSASAPPLRIEGGPNRNHHTRYPDDPVGITNDILASAQPQMSRRQTEPAFAPNPRQMPGYHSQYEPRYQEAYGMNTSPIPQRSQSTRPRGNTWQYHQEYDNDSGAQAYQSWQANATQYRHQPGQMNVRAPQPQNRAQTPSQPPFRSNNPFNSFINRAQDNASAPPDVIMEDVQGEGEVEGSTRR